MEIYNGTYSVYIHTNKINGKVYIGITSNPPYKRWGKDGKGYMNHDTLFCRAIKKYGWDNFEHEIISSNLTEQEASNMEKLLIKEFNSTNPEYGYNHEIGGLCNNEHIRRLHISNSITGNNHPFYDKHHTEETKQLLRESCGGENHYWYGKHLPKETCDKISFKLKGNKNWKKRAEQLKTPVICVELNRNFETIKEAAEYCGVTHCAISNCLRGKTQTSGGYHWKYFESQLNVS